ncbi:MAG: hypothetical protein HY763_02585 [Planctomycetes bacterium]|nr:hypothetical protein [Planctomycetota bacterium]
MFTRATGWLIVPAWLAAMGWLVAHDVWPGQRFFKVPLTDGRLITGGFNPLGRLTDLHIGQRWRMQVFNPIAALTGFGERFIPVVATVTGEEILSLESGPTCCRIVETPNAKAWVDQRGTVQVQEITLPVVGRMRMRREAVFDDAARRAATQGREFLQRGADL